MDILLFERYSAANSLAYALASYAKHAPSLRHYVWHEFFADLPPHNLAACKSTEDEIERFLGSSAFFGARPQEVTNAVLTAWANHEFAAEINVDT